LKRWSYLLIQVAAAILCDLLANALILAATLLLPTYLLQTGHPVTAVLTATVSIAVIDKVEKRFGVSPQVARRDTSLTR